MIQHLWDRYCSGCHSTDLSGITRMLVPNTLGCDEIEAMAKIISVEMGRETDILLVGTDGKCNTYHCREVSDIWSNTVLFSAECEMDDLIDWLKKNVSDAQHGRIYDGKVLLFLGNEENVVKVTKTSMFIDNNKIYATVFEPNHCSDGSESVSERKSEEGKMDNDGSELISESRKMESWI